MLDIKPYAKVTWGLYSDQPGSSGVMHTQILTKDQCDELWAKCKGAVNLGLMHYSIEPVESNA